MPLSWGAIGTGYVTYAARGTTHEYNLQEYINELEYTVPGVMRLRVVRNIEYLTCTVRDNGRNVHNL